MQVIHYELLVLAALLLSITGYAAFSAQLVTLKSGADIKRQEIRLRILAFGAGFISLAFMLGLINLYKGNLNGIAASYLFDLHQNEYLPAGKYRTADEPIVEISISENGDVSGRMFYENETFEFETMLNYYSYSGAYYVATANLFEDSIPRIAEELELVIDEVGPNNKFGLKDGHEEDKVALTYRLPGAERSTVVYTNIKLIEN